MLELIALAGLFMAGFAVLAIFGVIFLVLRIAFWAIFLPFRLLFLPFRLVFLPFRVLSKLIWLPILLPIFLLVGGIVAIVSIIAALVALVVPMIPFILLGLMIWAFVRRRPSVAT
jgi:hypothetical protein